MKTLLAHWTFAQYKNKHSLQSAYAWLGWRDSNPRMPAPKAGALPLGDTPVLCLNITDCTLILPHSQAVAVVINANV